MQHRKASLFVIFTTVLVDLIGFGIVIPLIALYGKHFGASAGELAILGASYSFMQFLFAPFWGTLSDRIGRRPVLLISLAGSTASYLLFAFADSLWLLIASRALAGLFAANISAAQSYIADITPPEKRAAGMGLIGAAFGLGFTLGPPIGGISSKFIGLEAPGLIAATICGINFLIACWRLPESLAVEQRRKTPFKFLSIPAIPLMQRSLALKTLVPVYFLITFAFSNFEQTFTLLIQSKFGLSTVEAGYQSGLALLWLGIVGVIVQGGLIRKLAPKFGEFRLLVTGLLIYAAVLASFPYLDKYWHFYLVGFLLASGSGLLNPSLLALISRNAPADSQGGVLGVTQGIGSLARMLGPAAGLSAFSWWLPAPFLLASFVALIALGLVITSREKITNASH